MLKASHAFRWVSCPASANDTGCNSRHQTEAVLEGLAAHYVASCVLIGNASCASDLIGHNSPQGIEITPEIANSVQAYVDYVGRPALMHIEELRENDFVSVKPDCVIDYGTGLEIVEFKHGWKIIEPYFNPQLMLGATAFIRPEHQHIKLTVVQPRPFHPSGSIRSHVLSPVELEYHMKYVWERAALTKSPVPPAHPAEYPKDYCDGCPRANSCAALAHEVYAGHDRPGQFGMLKARALQGEWAYLKTFAALTKARLNALEAEIESRIKAGEYIPGLFLKPRYGNRTFTVPVEVIQSVTDVELFKQVQISPAELEKEGLSRAILDQISTCPKIGHKIGLLTQKDVEKIFNGK